MNTQTLLTGWHFMRLLRLVAGLFITVQAIETHDALSGMIGGFFLFQAVTNTGCCGAEGCAVPITKKVNDNIEDVHYEELKSR